MSDENRGGLDRRMYTGPLSNYWPYIKHTILCKSVKPPEKNTFKATRLKNDDDFKKMPEGMSFI